MLLCRNKKRNAGRGCVRLMLLRWLSRGVRRVMRCGGSRLSAQLVSLVKVFYVYGDKMVLFFVVVFIVVTLLLSHMLPCISVLFLLRFEV